MIGMIGYWIANKKTPVINHFEKMAGLGLSVFFSLFLIDCPDNFFSSSSHLYSALHNTGLSSVDQYIGI